MKIKIIFLLFLIISLNALNADDEDWVVFGTISHSDSNTKAEVRLVCENKWKLQYQAFRLIKAFIEKNGEGDFRTFSVDYDFPSFKNCAKFEYENRK